MTTAIIVFLLLTTAASTTGLVFSVKKNLELDDKIDELSDAIQTSITILDEQRAKIVKKTKLEVFSDDVVIRELVRDIVVAKNAVTTVAKILDDSVSSDDLEIENNENV